MVGRAKRDKKGEKKLPFITQELRLTVMASGG